MKLIVVCCSALALLVAAPAAGAAVVPSPVTSLTAGPPELGNDATPSFTFSSDREFSTFDCRFAGSPSETWSSSGAFPCGSGEGFDDVTWTSGGVADGTHHFQVRACALIDTGNELVHKCDSSPAKRTFTVDTAAPAIDEWSVAPAAARVNTQVVIDFGSSEPGAVFRCRLDAGEPKPCVDRFYPTGVGNGPHTLSVEAGDALGNWSAPRTHSFVHDATGPQFTVSGPGETQDRTPTWTWNAAPPDGGAPYVLSCSLGGVAQACSGTSWTPAQPLADGVHELTVTQRDEAGNNASRSFAVRVDTVGPVIDSVVWQAEQKRIAIEAEPVALECRLDVMDPWSCGPEVDVSWLAPGAHTFTVRAVDLAGNESTKTISFTIPGEPTDPTDPTDPNEPDPGNGGGDPTDPTGPASPGDRGGEAHQPPPPGGAPVAPSGDAPRDVVTPGPVVTPAKPAKAKAKKRCAKKRKLAKRTTKKRAKRRSSCATKVNDKRSKRVAKRS